MDPSVITAHDFTGRTTATPSGVGRIDYIWYRGAIVIEDFSILTDTAGGAPGVFPSDHWPVMCQIIVP